MFSNAVLGSHDITALIRDTEAHERALFQIDPSTKPQRRSTRRGEEPARLYALRDNRNTSAVARVLGSDMMEDIKLSAGTSSGQQPGEIDIDVLLRGAEILCNV